MSEPKTFALHARRALAPLGLLALAVMAGCTADASSTDDASASDQDITASSLLGYYELSGDANNDTWIEQLALHGDGSFEASMGNDVSNLSGHHYPTTGTFGVAKHGASTVLTLHAVGTFAGDSSFELVVRGTQLDVKDHGAAGARVFVMQKAPITTITFHADWTISQTGPIVANAPYLIRYAATRDDCPVPAGGGVSLGALARFENGVTIGFTDGFNTAPVKGYLGAFGSVPPLGKDLAVWFKGSAQDPRGNVTSCTHWDSNLAKNYHFPVTP